MVELVRHFVKFMPYINSRRGSYSAMKRAHEEESATETKQRRKVRLPQPLNIPVGTVTPLRSSKEHWVETSVLTLIFFCALMWSLSVLFGCGKFCATPGVRQVFWTSYEWCPGLFGEVFRSGNPGWSSSTNEEIPGCKAKARPPMPSVASSSSHTSGVHVATPSHGSAKALPLPVEEKYRKQQLVVNPYEMKKFLYGTSQKIHDEDCINQNVLKFL